MPERKTAFSRSLGTGPLRRVFLALCGVAGMYLLLGETATAQGICGRTPQVRDKLMEVTGVSNCARVTARHLARVTSLDLSGSGIIALQEGDFRGLSGLGTLDLSHNRLWTLPEEIFSELHALQVLSLQGNLMVNFLTELPRGVFDDVLDTLEDLRVDPYLKATIDFATTAQETVAGTFVSVTVSLNRGPTSTLLYLGLPVAVRVPFSVEGTATAGDFQLPHSSNGEILFSGSPRQTIRFELSNDVSPGTTIVLRLAEPSRIGLRRYDGTGPDAPFLKTESLLERDDDRAVHTVTVVESVPADVCSRTPQVRDALVETTRGVDDCAEITTAHLTQVTLLYLPVTGIDALQAHDFSGLTSLEHLDLRYNRLSALPEGVFSGLTNLEVLLLVQNSLTSLPRTTFEGLESLQLLILAENQLKALPEGVFGGLSKLEWLNINDNSLVILPERVFDGLESLRFLLMWGNQLSELPEGIFSGLHALTELFLGYNQLSQLPEGAFGGLQALEHISLGSNQLSELPEGAFRGLHALESISLDSNQLSQLPEETFHGLDRLDVLWLQGNTLNALATGIFDGLDSLRNLSLDGNALTSLPEGVFDGLDSLQRLWLSDNRLAALPDGVFDGLKLLRDMRLGGNRLDSLPERVFRGLDNLAHLSLDRNPLDELPPGVFDDMLDTLGGDIHIPIFGMFAGTLEMDSHLKAWPGFASAAQRVADGADVRVPAHLSRELPVAVRVPYTLGIGGGGGGLTGLSPAPGGLLFTAGETRRDISFTLLKDTGAPRDRRFVLALAEPPEIGLYRSDGTGPAAPYLKPESLLLFAEEPTHTVTVIDPDRAEPPPFCLSLWDGAPCSAPAVLPHVLLGPQVGSVASTEVVVTHRDPGAADCEVALLFHQGTSEAPPVSFNGLFPDGNLLHATLPRGGASILTLTAPDAQAPLAGPLSLFTRSPCTGESLRLEGRTLLTGAADGEIEEMFSLPTQSPEDWLGDGDCLMVTGLFGNGRDERIVLVAAQPGQSAPPGTRLHARAFDLEGNFMGSLASQEVTGGYQVLQHWKLTRPTIIEMCLDVPGESGFRLAVTAIGSKETGGRVQYFSESLSSGP